MASIMEELISTLEEEESIYVKLIPIAEEKSNIIVNNDLDGLQRVTDQEHEMIDRIAVLEGKRVEAVKNIGTVLNRNPDGLDLVGIISMLDKQPKEQERLRELHDKLTATVKRLQDINYQNKQLIEESLEMIEFNMNYIQSTRMSPGSSSYNRRAHMNEAPSSQPKIFDAKQ